MLHHTPSPRRVNRGRHRFPRKFRNAGANPASRRPATATATDADSIRLALQDWLQADDDRERQIGLFRHLDGADPRLAAVEQELEDASERRADAFAWLSDLIGAGATGGAVALVRDQSYLFIVQAESIERVPCSDVVDLNR